MATRKEHKEIIGVYLYSDINQNRFLWVLSCLLCGQESHGDNQGLYKKCGRCGGGLMSKETISKPDEVWIPAAGTDGKYEISNFGNVRNENKRILRPGDNGGYKYLSLRPCGRKMRVAVHRLVAESFLPNPDNKPEINHKNGVKGDNFVSNLEWATRKENCEHYINTLGIKTPAPRFGVDNPLSVKIVRTDPDETIVFYASISDAVREGYHKGHIIDACKKRITKYRGSDWAYVK